MGIISSTDMLGVRIRSYQTLRLLALRVHRMLDGRTYRRAHER
jgi:hypothetical protein